MADIERERIKAEIMLELSQTFNSVLHNRMKFLEDSLQSTIEVAKIEVQNAGKRVEQRIDEISRTGAQRINALKESLTLAMELLPEEDRVKVRELFEARSVRVRECVEVDQ